MCWAERPLCRQGQVQREWINDVVWQRNGSNLYIAEDETRMHGWRAIPGTAQVPGEFTAGDQKIYVVLEPVYGWHHAFLTGNRSVSTKEERGATSTLQRMIGDGMIEASAEWIQDLRIFAKTARAAVVWANVGKLLMVSWVTSLNKTL